MSGDGNKKKRGRLLSWGLNLAGFLIFVLILWLGGVKAWQQIVHGDWRYILAALTVTLLWNLVAAYRWAMIAGSLSTDMADCPFRYYFTFHMIGMFLGQVVPITVGMLGGRPAALSLSRGVSLKRSAFSVFVDKLFDLVLALLLVIPVALYLVGWIGLGLAFGLMAGLAAAGALVVGWRYEAIMHWGGQLGVRLARPLARVPVIGQRLPAQLDRLAEATFLSNRLALRSFLLTLVLYALLSARLFFISEALRLEIPWYLLTMGVCVTQLALVFSVTPGSLGFLEGGWAAVLGLAGLTVEQFTTFVLGRRAYFMVFTLLCTLLAFGWIRESPARLFRAVLAASRQQAAPAEGTPTGDIPAA